MGNESWQNRVAPKDGLDDFPTKPWATRAFLYNVLSREPEDTVVWEPCANRGFMTRTLQERFNTVIGSDVEDYGFGFPVIDFLTGPTPMEHGQPVEWIITNPPFNKGLDVALRALELKPRVGVALLLRTTWVEGQERFTKLFQDQPPYFICQYTERVGFDHGKVTSGGDARVPYAWFVWRFDKEKSLWPRFRWIPPLRKRLEKESDYEY